MNDANYSAWIGKRETRRERLNEAMIDGLNAVLDRDSGTPLGLHWLLCADRRRASELGPDGHPRRGDFLPPVTLPRRMWAAGSIRLLAQAPADKIVIRDSVIADISHKQGRSGQLVFVKVDHRYHAEGMAWIDERHTIVYRGAEGTQLMPPTIDATEFDWRMDIATDEVTLFRYSALTFNSHRIHYDQRYVREVEGYPNLIVHGPLMATWLMNFARDQLTDESLVEFDFKVGAPVFVGETITLLGRRNDEQLTLAVASENKRQIISASGRTATT
ncbi:MAG: acyl-CoA dehydrogenase [marine bacterium B5-7]|nr:MAG: acyl-CoA dehydrogenase [marine bacterium B5-7]